MNGRWHRVRCLYLTDNHAGHHSIPHTSVSVTSFCTALTRKEVIMTNRSRYHGHTAQPQSTISSKIVAVFALMLVIAFAVALAKYLQTSENQTTNVTFASSERISDNSLRVWVDVKRKNVDTPAYCIVTALNYGGGGPPRGVYFSWWGKPATVAVGYYYAGTSGGGGRVWLRGDDPVLFRPNQGAGWCPACDQRVMRRRQ